MISKVRISLLELLSEVKRAPLNALTPKNSPAAQIAVQMEHWSEV